MAVREKFTQMQAGDHEGSLDTLTAMSVKMTYGTVSQIGFCQSTFSM